MRFRTALAALCTASLGLAATPAVAGGGNTITDIVVATSSADGFDDNRFDYDILLTAVLTAGLEGALADETASYTVFAPNDGAFIRLARDLGFDPSDDTFDTLEESVWNFLVGALTDLDAKGNPVSPLTEILLYHVSPEDIAPIDLFIRTFTGDPIQTLQGATFRPRFFRLVDNDPDFVNPRVAVPLNIAASNGRIHTINRVLLPLDLP